MIKNDPILIIGYMGVKLALTYNTHTSMNIIGLIQST